MLERKQSKLQLSFGDTTTEEQERVVVDAPMPRVLDVQQQIAEVVKVILHYHVSEPTVGQMVVVLVPSCRE